MVRRAKKRKRSELFGTSTSTGPIPRTGPPKNVWKAVDVSLGSHDVIDQNNHYDDSILATKADLELEADPKEHPGLFFGLEVIDGSQYEVIDDKQNGSKKFIIRDSRQHLPKQYRSSENSESVVSEEIESSLRKKKSKKKRKKERPPETRLNDIIERSQFRDEREGNADAVDELLNKDSNEEKLELIQSHWLQETSGVALHPSLCKALAQNNWSHPTPIQAAVLPAAILGRRNIVGAAPTGSGKTLAFLLPIYQYMLEKHDQNLCIGENRASRSCLEALILTPTRELALQIHDEAQKLWEGHIGTLVGGLALAKQQRVLDKNRPSVIAATPGRLWELISSRQHEHLNDLSQIRFLVIDEADRMIQRGSFPQLTQILDAIHMANPMEESDDDEEDEGNESLKDENDRLLALPGIPGEAKVVMLSDTVLENVKAGKPDVVDSAPDQTELDDKSDAISFPVLPPVTRQTFVYSATLMLPGSSTTKNKLKRVKNTVEGAIAEILEKARAKGPTKIIDLTKAETSQNRRTISIKDGRSNEFGQTTISKESTGSTKTTTLPFRLPDGLTLQEIKCTQMHKDSFLYAYLMTTSYGLAGPALVFCSSIAAVRRVAATLNALGLPVRTLHAKMEQRARLKAVESLFDGNKSRAIVVATDVAARGLDIPSVSTVVHYDAARTLDAFIHRSGRTARGIGKEAIGCSLSLVSPNEDKFRAAIIRTFHIEFEQVHLDGRLLRSAQERVNLASKLVSAESKQTKAERQNQWFKETAGAAGIEIDESCINECAEAISKTEKNSHEFQVAKLELQRLLTQPMQTQKFGKFLSTNSGSDHYGGIQSKKQRRNR